MRVNLLSEYLGALNLQTQALQQAVADHPLDAPCVFTDLYGDGADDLCGLCAEGNELAVALLQAWEAGRWRTVQQHLMALTGNLERLRSKLTFDLLYPRAMELVMLGEERGGEWRPWSEVVCNATEGCLEPLLNCEHALTHCWEDLTACLLSRHEHWPALTAAPVFHLEESL